jgi:hypothetical protein
LKRKVVISICAVLLLLVSVGVYIYNNQSYKNIYYSNGEDEAYLKSFNITLEPTNIEPKINKIKIRNIAEKMLRKAYIKPKEVHLEYGLITDKGISVKAFSKEALEANADLKSYTSVSQIPVWLVTFKGLLPDDYKQEESQGSSNIPGRQPLDISTTVIDAMSGEVLYYFGTSDKSYR